MVDLLTVIVRWLAGFFLGGDWVVRREFCPIAVRTILMRGSHASVGRFVDSPSGVGWTVRHGSVFMRVRDVGSSNRSARPDDVFRRLAR